MRKTPSTVKTKSLVPLQAGPLEMLFDTETAFLRYVRLGEREVVRGVFAAIRDRDWNTLPFTLSNLHMVRQSRSFEISFCAHSTEPEIAFEWSGRIEGRVDGQLTYHFHGTAQGSFWKNRIGLCVLHPIRECAGNACVITHTDDSASSTSSTNGRFPTFISPHQPFKSIRSIEHSVQTGVAVRVTMTGETFEMEDQRNWTDASFKTYSTPLEEPFPVQLQAGDVIQQSVSIELITQDDMAPPLANADANANADAATRYEEIAIKIVWQRPLPRAKLGFQVPRPFEKLSSKIVERLIKMQPDHLRVDLWLDDDDMDAQLDSAIDLARTINSQLELALFCGTDFETQWQRHLPYFQHARTRIARWLVFSTSEKATPDWLTRSAQKALGDFEPHIPIAVGTDAYFAELNRERPKPIETYPVCFSMNPQVHAFDNLTIRESLEAQMWTVDSVREYFGVGSVISPITLRPRFNPNSTSGTQDPNENRNATIDPRQPSGFTAAWTTGILAGLALNANVQSLTIYEICGPQGIMSADAADYPVAPVFDFALLSKMLFPASSSQPRDVIALGAMDANDSAQVLIGNMSEMDHCVHLSLLDGKTRKINIPAESIMLLQDTHLWEPNHE